MVNIWSKKATSRSMLALNPLDLLKQKECQISIMYICCMACISNWISIFDACWIKSVGLEKINLLNYTVDWFDTAEKDVGFMIFVCLSNLLFTLRAQRSQISYK